MMEYAANSKRRSSGVLIVVIAFHWLLISAAVHFSSLPAKPSQLQTVIRLIQLSPEGKKMQQDVVAPAPALNNTAIHFNLRLPETYPVQLDNRQGLSGSSESRNRNERSTGIFDPRLQRKLQDATERNSRSLVTRESNWMDATGRSHVNLGNGKCLKSVVPIRAGNATDWELPSHCGQSEGEKMLKNIEADLARAKP